jgi:AcrR family transcriptional regulator
VDLEIVGMGGEEQATRSRLLDAARQLFAERGFAETTTREIAARAECNLSLIAHYFGSKEGLLRELVVAKVNRGRDQLAILLARPAPFAEKLRAWIDFMVEQLAGDLALTRISHREAFHGHELIPDPRAVLQGKVALFRALIEQAQAAGELRQDLAAEHLAVCLNGLLQFYFVASPITSQVVGPITPERLAEHRRHVLEIFLRGATPASA